MLFFKRLHFSCHGQNFLIAALYFQTKLVQLYMMNLIFWMDGLFVNKYCRFLWWFWFNCFVFCLRFCLDFRKRKKNSTLITRNKKHFRSKIEQWKFKWKHMVNHKFTWNKTKKIGNDDKDRTRTENSKTNQHIYFRKINNFLVYVNTVVL